MDIRISGNQLTECWNRLKQFADNLPPYVINLRVFRSKKKPETWCIRWDIDEDFFIVDYQFHIENYLKAKSDFEDQLLKCVYGENYGNQNY